MKKAILITILILLIGVVLTQGFGCTADTDKEPAKGLQGINKGLEQPHNKGLQEKAETKGFSDSGWDIKLPLKGS